MDPPWGIIPHDPNDVPIPDGDMDIICSWFKDLLVEDANQGFVGIRLPNRVPIMYRWQQSLEKAGFVVDNPLMINYPRNWANTRCHYQKNLPGATVLNHVWLMARKRKNQKPVAFDYWGMFVCHCCCCCCFVVLFFFFIIIIIFIIFIIIIWLFICFFFTHTDENISKMPASGNIIDNIPRLGSDLKLTQVTKVLDENGNETDRVQIVRTQENNIQEWFEIIHRFVPVGGMFADFTAGTLVSGLAALRMGRKAVLNEKDSVCMALAKQRLRYYFSYLQKQEVKILLGHDPPSWDGWHPYEWNKHAVLAARQVDFMTVPVNNIPLHWNRYTNDTEAYGAHLKAQHLQIMDSGLPGAGKGLFITKSRKTGDILGPYFGVYTQREPSESRGKGRALLLTKNHREDKDLYMIGDAHCPVSFINDATVSCNLCFFVFVLFWFIYCCFFFFCFFFFLFFFFCYYNYHSS